MKISHLSIYQISKDGVFDNVNSYKDLNENIKKYGESLGTPGTNEYNNTIGSCFEVFTQFFCIKYGNHPLLGIKNIQDTSDDPYTEGYDFTFVDFKNRPGQIQSKWRNNPSYQFTIGDLGTNGEMARNLNIEKDNNILFINFDDSDNLFNFRYKTARNARRIFDRKSQEESILRDPNFWDDFRLCIKESSKNKFEDPYKPRDIQDWMLNGIKKDGILYEGAEAVVSGKYSHTRTTRI